MNKGHENSETAKYRHLTVPYCNGNGVDIGSGGDPVVPWAISMDLPRGEFATYHSQHDPRHAIHYGGDAKNLPFKDATLDFLYSSHLLEDFLDWDPVLTEWARVVKPNGYVIILVPDKALWKAALDRGQPPNCAHTHESRVGELSEHYRRLGMVEPVIDSLTNQFDGDYTVMFVGRKL
jgi:SAM-dependent methyltransferase